MARGFWPCLRLRRRWGKGVRGSEQKLRWAGVDGVLRAGSMAVHSGLVGLSVSVCPGSISVAPCKKKIPLQCLSWKMVTWLTFLNWNAKGWGKMEQEAYFSTLWQIMFEGLWFRSHETYFTRPSQFFQLWKMHSAAICCGYLGSWPGFSHPCSGF